MEFVKNLLKKSNVPNQELKEMVDFYKFVLEMDYEIKNAGFTHRTNLLKKCDKINLNQKQ